MKKTKGSGSDMEQKYKITSTISQKQAKTRDMEIQTESLQLNITIEYLPHCSDMPDRVFISEDPIGFAGDRINLYMYAGNNPLLLIDPWGLRESAGLSFGEANRHWREGGSAPLSIDVNTLDLSNVSQLPSSGQVHFAGDNFSSINDALVYGTVTLFPGPDNTVIGGFDTYNFDMKPWSLKTVVRNVETMIGRFYAGSGTPYRIEFTGTVSLGDGQ